jgi:phosphoribosylglycinamide formyltransferase-1
MGRVVVLVSGRGSNLRALVEAGIPVTAVISNRPDAGALAFAAGHHITTAVVDHKAFLDRESFDAALSRCIDAHAPQLVVLAGFMRVLTSGFVQRYAGRLLNIHPSLLPAFTGLDTHTRALAAGAKLHGCTVHFVTEALDHGPIVAQAAVPVLDGDMPDTLAARVLRQEHRLLPAAVRWFLEGRLTIDGLRVKLSGSAEHGEGALLEPVP